MKDVRGFFRPEFINRVDKVIIFDPLTHDNVTDIVKLLITDLEKRLLDKDISIEFSDEALSLLAEKSYDPEYGARPARRVIADMIEDPITHMILDQEVKSKQRLHVSLNKGDLKFDVKLPKAQKPKTTKKSTKSSTKK